MHELGIMTGVMEAVQSSARQAGATKVTKVTLSVGVMTEAIEDALQFAYEVLSEDTMCAESELVINMIAPKSRCHECSSEFEHDRYHVTCPSCGSYATELIAGKELHIESIEVDIPDKESDVEDKVGAESEGKE